MKTPFTITTLCLCMFLFSGQAKPAEAPKDWREQWQTAGKQLSGVAEAMPAEKYGYKPVPEVQSFGEQIKHAMLAMKVYIANAQDQKLDLKKLSAEINGLKTKDDIVPELRKTIDAGMAAISTIAGEKGSEVIDTQFYGKTTRRFLLLQAIAHNNNHYGQLTVHLRLNGITPPASRR